MPIDILMLRESHGGNPKLVRESQEKRFQPPTTVEKVIELDTKWRDLKHKLDLLKGEKNKCDEEIKKRK